jgi:hypothetical protein
MMLIRTTPAYSPETEALVTRTIGCALRVHQALVGLLMNFHSEFLKSSLRRFVL